MRHPNKGRSAGPSQRQLRAGELVRQNLADILRDSEINDGALEGVSVTVTEVRMSPDLRHAQVYVEPLGGIGVRAVVEGLNRAAKFLRGKLGRAIGLKFTPDLRFVHDESFEEADRMERLIAEARRADDARHVEEDGDEEAPAGSVRYPEPFPLEGGRVGMGVGAPAVPQTSRETSPSPAPSDTRAAPTPIPNPSPLEGEGS